MRTLRLHVSDGSRTTILMFPPRFPITVGRDPSCDCCLGYPVISRRHARLDLRDGRLLLSDMGSRLGTGVLGGRLLEPGEEFDLEKSGYEFSVGVLRLRAALIDGPDVVDTDLSEHDTPVDQPNVQTSFYEESNIDPLALDADAIEQALREALEEHQRGCDAVDRVLVQASACRGGHLARLAQFLIEADPEWDGRATVRQFVTASGVRPAPARVDATALRVLHDFAASYVPHAPPLTGVEAVTAFVTRLDAVLALLFEGVAAMRYAFAKETGRDDSGGPERGDLAAGLLDWTNDGRSLDRMREEFGLMVAHHRRLVDGAVTGLERILERLNPEGIELDCERASAWWPRGRGARWLEFVRRYEALGRVRERALGPVFMGALHALRGSPVGRAMLSGSRSDVAWVEDPMPA